ncbi:hypothetical protein ACFLVC_04155 [Chloroflexota bacterium]
MKSSSSIARIGLLLILLVAPSFVLGACNPSPPVPLSDSMVTISVDNGTRETLQIFHNDVFIGKISQYAEIKWKADGTLPKQTITAKDTDGIVVYSTTFLKDDVSRKNTYRVVIPPNTKGVQ